MNRYLVSGILKDALAGKQVIVVTERQRDVTNTLEALAAAVPPVAVLTVSRANGSEHMVFRGGGSVRLLAANRGDSLRGFSADVVVLCDGAAEHWEMLQEAMYIAIAMNGGEVIRA